MDSAQRRSVRKRAAAGLAIRTHVVLPRLSQPLRKMDQKTPRAPAYNKPKKPGIWMNFDNTVGLYLIIAADDSFDQAAQAVFAAIREAEARFPGWPRMLYLDIVGHDHARGGFTNEFVEFQQEFWFSVIAPFLTAFELPLTGCLLNPDPQRNDMPDDLVIREAT